MREIRLSYEEAGPHEMAHQAAALRTDSMTDDGAGVGLREL
jgi:hypothetical protein